MLLIVPSSFHSTSIFQEISACSRISECFTESVPFVITNCSNNYGPNQFPEKLIPLFIHNIKNNKPLPVYGKGENVRDWLYVIDHAHAIDTVFHNGKKGETYNIGGFNEWKNIDLIKVVCKAVVIINQKYHRRFLPPPFSALRSAADRNRLRLLGEWRCCSG